MRSKGRNTEPMRRFVASAVLLVLSACSPSGVTNTVASTAVPEALSTATSATATTLERRTSNGINGLGTVSNDVVLGGPTGRELTVRVSAPTTPGSYPLIIWSHGLGGSHEAYEPLVSHWVDSGYIVVRPRHGDSLKYRAGERLNITEAGQLRPLEVSAVLDQLEVWSSSLPTGIAIAEGPVGVGGHSFGALTTQAIIGARIQSVGAVFRDERYGAALMISPTGVSELWGEDPFGGFDVPMMVVTGTNDDLVETWENRLLVYEQSGSVHKTLAVIIEAEHSFGGISGADRGNRGIDAVGDVQTLTLAFWDELLKGSVTARQFLTRGMNAGTEHEVESKSQR